MNKHTSIFAFTYLIQTLIFVLMAVMLSFEAGGTLNIAAAVVAGFAAAWKFVKEECRLPTNAEKKKFAWQGLLSVCAISLIQIVVVLVVMLSAAELKVVVDTVLTKAYLIILAASLPIVVLVYYLAIRWSFSWYANVAFDSKLMEHRI